MIYVGKAKKLKIGFLALFWEVIIIKTTKLVQEIVDFEYVVTDSERPFY